VLENQVGRKGGTKIMVNDSIADMLTRMRNALVMKYNNVEVIGTKMNLGIAEILKREGYIEDFQYEKNSTGDKLTLTLKYGAKKERVITGLKRISKSGLRVYATVEELPRVLNGLGIAIISTSKGLMTDKEARKEGLGGEVLAYIW
jgi:small subunit ribosomal protein S8